MHFYSSDLEVLQVLVTLPFAQRSIKYHLPWVKHTEQFRSRNARRVSDHEQIYGQGLYALRYIGHPVSPPYSQRAERHGMRCA